MMRITESWLKDPATQQVCAALTSKGAQALFVGGCVRNALLQAPVSDLDLATDAPPRQVMDLAIAAGIKAIPTGVEHGTVTLVCKGIPFEVTTFRKDIETDGRRAVVSYSTDIAEDAARRDFTMNGLYARPDGTIVDPLGGLDDLRARRVRFIGTADDRIREDYLRSLRFFRFHAWYGDAQNGFDRDAVDAIARNLDGLAQLSRERVGAEMLKLLSAPDPAPSVAGMRATGVLNQLLPGVDDRALAPLVHLEGDRGIDPMRRLAVLCDESLADTLRLSKSQRKTHALLRDSALGSDDALTLGYRLGSDNAISAILVRAALLEQAIPPETDPDIALGATAVFPVSSTDLMPDLTGANLGRAMRQLETAWIASRFTLSRKDLLSKLG
jgi:poly(A) polymerase